MMIIVKEIVYQNTQDFSFHLNNDFSFGFLNGIEILIFFFFKLTDQNLQFMVLEIQKIKIRDSSFNKAL